MVTCKPFGIVLKFLFKCHLLVKELNQYIHICYIVDWFDLLGNCLAHRLGRSPELGERKEVLDN